MLLTGTRYSQVNYGLLIRNITDADNGIYTCAAEVQSTGALAQREIEVIVYRKFITEFSNAFNGLPRLSGLKLLHPTN